MAPGKLLSIAGAVCLGVSSTSAAENVYILDVPDYTWYAGCFGTASGNLMGYWDRNGFPNFYTGPTAGGVAPLNTFGANSGIRSMWASKAGFDGRPADQPGHIDDYWEYFQDEVFYSYESPATDPYRLAGRAEHTPDSVGDFIGASQNKWTDLNGECSGNIDAFAFNFWNQFGARRLNYTPPPQDGIEVRDIQSGWRKWAASRGYEADVFSQLVDFNPSVTAGSGFTFEDLKKEIDAGYPVMLFLQNPNDLSRTVQGVAGMNPMVHGMVAYGYVTTDSGVQFVRYRTSWGSGDGTGKIWSADSWEAGMTLRGVIGFRPQPKITAIRQTPQGLRIQWDGPSSKLYDQSAGETTEVHQYVIEKSDTLEPAGFTAASEISSARETVVANSPAFYRVKLLPRDSAQ